VSHPGPSFARRLHDRDCVRGPVMALSSDNSVQDENRVLDQLEEQG
jgi:hypothetical protein